MKSTRNRHNMSALFFIITVFSFSLIFMRFSQIMVHGEIDGEDLEENVERLYTSNSTLQANRGTIFDRHGNPLAIDATSYKLIAILTDKWSTPENPVHIQDAEAVANVLANYINLSVEDILGYLNKPVDQVEFGSVGNSLSYHTASHIKAELEAQGLSGIIFEEKQKRLYPNGTFASHTIGLAQYPNSTDEEADKQLVGQMGLEQTFNDVLTGKNGERTIQRDSSGYIVPKLKNEVVEPVNGDNLYLTLDHKLQVHLESILTEVQEENNPKAMTATVMHAETGEIIATSQRPSFNATTLENIDASWQNLLTEYTLEPGSTMKILTLAAAIEEGVFQPNQYFKSGTIQAHGRTVSDYIREGWGWISQLEGIARSSNVLMVHLIDEMGHDTWKEYLDAFGFGQPTGISLPNEQAGFNPYTTPIQAVNTGFGQGISVTPIQMLQAFTAVANEGEMVQPKVLDKKVDSTTGEETVYQPEGRESPISPETAQKTLDYLTQSLNFEEAVAKPFQKEGYSIVAKTGTAEVYDDETKTYSTSEFIHSIAAMFPAEDPKYIVYIAIQNPQFTPDAAWGAAVVEKVYHPLVDRIIDFNEKKYDDVEDGPIQYVQTPSFLDYSVEEATKHLVANGRDYTLIGTGTDVVQQYPYPETPLFVEEQIILMTNGAATMPDITGWSRNDALKVAELTGVNMHFSGEGYVVEQSLAPGSYMDPSVDVKVTLSEELNNVTPATSEETTENQ